MKHLLLSLALCFSVASISSAQLTTEKGAKSDQVNMKMHEVDMLLQIMPLLLKKEQINDKILPAIEKARELFRKELAYEDDELAKLDPILSEAITAAYEKGAYPSRKITDEVAAKTKSLALKRSIVQIEMVADITEMLTVTLDAGQKKVMLGSFDPKFIDPSVKPESMSDERKTNFFVQRVFMDTTSYEILKKLAK